MTLLIDYLIAVIAFQHLGFLILEMFLWTKPTGLKIFGQTLEQARTSASLAANQGLYNGFLAAGLIWSLVHSSPDIAFQLRVFFLGCVVLAGVYGGYSVNKRILVVQALPAAIALILSIWIYRF